MDIYERMEQRQIELNKLDEKSNQLLKEIHILIDYMDSVLPIKGE